MRKLTKKYRVHLAGWLLLLALLPVSCIKDDYAPKDKATVTVTFTTRAISGNPNTSAEILETNEHMRALRVIVARSSDKEILYNVKYNIDEVETRKTITFSELTIEKGGELFDFYAIANEVGVGYKENWATITVDELNKIDLTTDVLTNLNTNQNDIPQTAHRQIMVGEQVTTDTTIPLQFAVAKVRLTINNTSTVQQTVSGIKLSGLNMTSTPLFFAETDLSAVVDGVVELGDMTIPAGNAATVYAYFYENQNANGYQLTANWNNKEQTLLLETDSDGNKQTITEIPRGKMLDIYVTLNADVDIKPTIKVQVNKWDGKTMDVPAFV